MNSECFYRGRIAPSPTGYLHLGHASTFKIAEDRAKENSGGLVLRIEDLDRFRCKKEYEEAIIEDLKAMGIRWSEGPIRQSERIDLYREIWDRLKKDQKIYPCSYSRKEIEAHIKEVEGEEEGVFPNMLRPKELDFDKYLMPGDFNWRFRVPEGRKIKFMDVHYGMQEFEAGKDFGDFLVWRREGVPSYELAVVVDDYMMGITEVVRGADLLKSTARQILIYESLGWGVPGFYHCDLVCDAHGRRLAKRSGSERFLK